MQYDYACSTLSKSAYVLSHDLQDHVGDEQCLIVGALAILACGSVFVGSKGFNSVSFKKRRTKKNEKDGCETGLEGTASDTRGELNKNLLMKGTCPEFQDKPKNMSLKAAANMFRRD
uniref:Uncharacterized protein n=1 Tax=Oryza sativa subsp. japonica TaxID=39947 RepID=Q8H5F6_ORYSJ|nr:hypothetical protein [Oryza sativa Japonica Group]BAD30302.1 hypothetical protein [Oryza sativa Japonica Group]